MMGKRRVAVVVGAATATLVGVSGPALGAGRPAAPQAVAARSVAAARALLPVGVLPDCTGPAGDPAPVTVAWTVRDELNQYCATTRQADELSSPAFASAFAMRTGPLYADQNLAMFAEPGHPHVTLGQLVPGGSTADPFRTVDSWTASRRGRAVPVSFAASDGAQLNGYVFEPPAPPAGRPVSYPGVVITTGSIQGYQQMYLWAAEGLAEAGYMVLTYDVQGQGDSDTLPASCAPGNCPGVPFQQNYNFYQGTTDALNFFFSSPARPYPNARYTAGAPAGVSTVGQHLTAYNPAWSALDRSRVGLAGHSLGAAAVSQVGQCDTRVRAVVAWDNLAPATSCTGTGPATVRIPALGINSEYFLNPEPMTSVPDPHAKDAAFAQLKAAGVDTMQIALRSSSHLEYSYVPYILPASSLGERVAFFYTLAWFDYYLRHQSAAFDRLVATSFDGSSDAHSIGAGGYSPTTGNVPWTIAGLPVADRLSFYYESEYALTPPGGHTQATCVDMRAGCPATAPATP